MHLPGAWPLGAFLHPHTLGQPAHPVCTLWSASPSVVAGRPILPLPGRPAHQGQEGHSVECGLGLPLLGLQPPLGGHRAISSTPVPGKQAWQPWEGPGSHPDELGLGSHPGSEQREHSTAGLPPPWPALTLPGCPGAPSVWGDTQPDTPQSHSACLPTCPLGMAAGSPPHSSPGSSMRHSLLTASV